jgi:hypothetical protein
MSPKLYIRMLGYGGLLLSAGGLYHLFGLGTAEFWLGVALVIAAFVEWAHATRPSDTNDGQGS